MKEARIRLRERRFSTEISNGLLLPFPRRTSRHTARHQQHQGHAPPLPRIHRKNGMLNLMA